MVKSQSTEVQVFVGGLDLVKAPHLLAPTASRFLEGVNLRKGNIAPFLAPLLVEKATDSYMYYYRNQYYYYPTHRSNILHNRVWYWTSVLASGKVYPDGTEMPLGINPPVDTPLAVIESDVDKLSGSINYVYTYFDPVSLSESPPSKPSNTLDFIAADEGKRAKVTNLTPSPDGLQTRLYRIGGSQTVYTLVDTLVIGVNDYTDDKTYVEIQGGLLDTIRAYPPPTGLMYLSAHQGRFFGSVGATLYFTPIGKPDSWYLLDQLVFDDNITAVVSVTNGLLVMAKYKTWLVTGNNIMNFSIHLLSEEEGCLSFASVAVQSGTAIWLSADGFNMSNGGRLDNLSLNKIGRIGELDPYGAVVVDKRYVMSFNTNLYPSDTLFPSESLHPADMITEAGIGLPAGAMVIDFTLSPPAFSTIKDDTMGYVTEADNDVYQIDNSVTTPSLSKSFQGSKSRPIEVLTPLYTEGSIGMLKRYEKIRVVYLGTGTIKAFDSEGRKYVEQELDSTRKKSEWVNIPVGFNSGYGIQIEVKGNLIVDSLKWNWTQQESQ